MTIGDIQNRIYMLTGTNVSSFTNANMLISINVALNRIATLVMKADGRWQWDDDNQSDLPIGTTALAANQQDYSIPATFLDLLRVEIKYSGQTYFSKLDPVDQEDREDLLDATNNGIDNVTTGIPQKYDIVGRSVFLYPIPNYSQAASLKFYFKRGPVEFTSADLSTGTKVPGFDSRFHDLISLWVAYDYAIAKSLTQAGGWLAEIQRKEAELLVAYAKRNADDSPRMTMSPIPFL